MSVTEQAMYNAIKGHRADRLKIMRLAHELIELERRRFDEYEESVNKWYRHRHLNQGHTFPVCIHGSSRWTDYDNICGGCEDGDSYFDYLRVAKAALREAQARWDNYWEAQDKYIWMVSHGYDNEAAGKFSQWAHDKYLVVR